MPIIGEYTLLELKDAIDAAITSKTLPFSIDNVDDGVLRKTVVEDLFLKIQNSINLVAITGTGTTTYVNTILVNKTIMLVITDNVVRIPSDFIFTSSTGTVVFSSIVDVDTIIQIIYK